MGTVDSAKGAAAHFQEAAAEVEKMEAAASPTSIQSACRLTSNLHIYSFMDGGLHRLIVHPEGMTTVRMLCTTTGGATLRDGRGHFDFLCEALALDNDAGASEGQAGDGQVGHEGPEHQACLSTYNSTKTQDL